MIRILSGIMTFTEKERESAHCLVPRPLSVLPLGQSVSGHVASGQANVHVKEISNVKIRFIYTRSLLSASLSPPRFTRQKELFIPR